MQKVTIQFPALQKGVKISKEAAETSPYNYVNIHNGHAIVVTPYTIVVMNLQDYFLNYQQSAADERQEFNKLMDWIEGKSFTPGFWDFLTSQNDVSVIDDDKIFITGEKYDKELTYHENDVDLTTVLDMLENNWKTARIQTHATGVANSCLDSIQKAVGKIVGSSAMVLEFTPNSTTRFTFENFSCIFGVFLSSIDAVVRPNNFDQMKTFVEFKH